MNAYYVKYRMGGIYNTEKGIGLLARNKADAYDKAVYEVIPETEGQMPYSAWVTSVTYNNGNVKYFNTSEGNPY